MPAIHCFMFYWKYWPILYVFCLHGVISFTQGIVHFLSAIISTAPSLPLFPPLTLSPSLLQLIKYVQAIDLFLKTGKLFHWSLLLITLPLCWIPICILWSEIKGKYVRPMFIISSLHHTKSSHLLNLILIIQNRRCFYLSLDLACSTSGYSNWWMCMPLTSTLKKTSTIYKVSLLSSVHLQRHSNLII